MRTKKSCMPLSKDSTFFGYWEMSNPSSRADCIRGIDELVRYTMARRKKGDGQTDVYSTSGQLILSCEDNLITIFMNLGSFREDLMKAFMGAGFDIKGYTTS